MVESEFQKNVRLELSHRLPGCIVLKNDANYIQGFPDLLVLYNNRWAALECKRSINEHHQPNQDWYITKLNGMSYASFIFPENREKVMNDLERSLKT